MRAKQKITYLELSEFDKLCIFMYNSSKKSTWLFKFYYHSNSCTVYMINIQIMNAHYAISLLLSVFYNYRAI